MGLRPTQGDEKRLLSEATLRGSAALTFVISPAPACRGAEAERLQFRGPFLETGNLVPPQNCHLDRSAAQWRDLCVDAPSWKCFRPERTRISYHAELATSTCAPFRRERCSRNGRKRIRPDGKTGSDGGRIANATNFYRKSGAARWRACPGVPRDLRFLCSSPHPPPQSRKL
jgi:hypothetical protein